MKPKEKWYTTQHNRCVYQSAQQSEDPDVSSKTV